MKKILLRNSWQVNNIGDIAHPLGFLKLAKQFLPEYDTSRDSQSLSYENDSAHKHLPDTYDS